MQRVFSMNNLIIGIIGLICIVFYSMGIITTTLLGSIQLETYTANDFRDFGASLLTLFELAVVNDWNLTMYEFVKALNHDTSIQFFFAGW